MADILTPENPFLFRINGKVPSLKNDRTFVIEAANKQVFSRPNNEVLKAKRSISATIGRAMERLGLSMLPKNAQVRCYAELGYYAQSLDVIPKQDNDNVWTTIQECLMGTLIEDDRLVEGFTVRRKLLPAREFVYQKIWVWKYDRSRDDYPEDLINLNRGEKPNGYTSIDTVDLYVEGDDELLF